MHNYLEILIIIGSLGGMMYVMLHFMLKEIHKDLADIKQEQRDARKRTDHLYQICIEMLGTRHKGH